MKSRCGRCPPLNEKAVTLCAEYITDNARPCSRGVGHQDFQRHVGAAMQHDACLQSAKPPYGHHHRVSFRRPVIPYVLFCRPLALQKPPPFHHIQLCNPVVPSSWSGLTLARYRPPPFAAQAQAPILSGPPVAHLKEAPPYHYLSHSPPFVRNMSNVSPSAMLLWSVLSCIELIFLFVHLWRYDRLQVSHAPRSPDPPMSLITRTVSQVEFWSESRCLQEGYDLWISFGDPLYWCAILHPKPPPLPNHTIFRRFLCYDHGQDQVRGRLYRSPCAGVWCNTKASPVVVESKH